MRLIIPKFAKYNPRGDVKNPSWVRLERNWWVDMFGWPADVQRVWFMLLGLTELKAADADVTAALRARNVDGADTGEGVGVLKVEAAFVAANLGIPVVSVFEAVAFLDHKNRIILMELDDTLRARNADDTHTGVTGRDGTGRDGTGREDSSRGAKPAGTALKIAKPPKPSGEGGQVWEAYAAAYQAAYQHPPVRNAKTNALCSQLVKRLGLDDAVKVVGFYLTHRKAWYVQSVHQLEYCVKDAEALRTQYLAGHQVTAGAAQQIDANAGSAQVFANIAKRMAKQGDPEWSQT